jgi:hypothetical protein
VFFVLFPPTAVDPRLSSRVTPSEAYSPRSKFPAETVQNADTDTRRCVVCRANGMYLA